MHAELDHFLRQLIGAVVATLLPLVFLVFLHMPAHLLPADDARHVVALAQAAPAASQPMGTAAALAGAVASRPEVERTGVSG